MLQRQRRIPDSKVHGANMGPTWVLSAPDGPHVGPMNLAMRDKLNRRIDEWLHPTEKMYVITYLYANLRDHSMHWRAVAAFTNMV